MKSFGIRSGLRAMSHPAWKSGAILAVLCVPSAVSAKPLQEDLERAAVIGAALNLCDISDGVGSHGWVDSVGRGSDKIGISYDAGREVVEARTHEIIAYLNREAKLDEFCANARREGI